jgi:hypothetical protein
MKKGGDQLFFLQIVYVTLLHCPIRLSVFFISFRFYVCLLPSAILVEDVDQNGHICLTQCGKIYVMSEVK